MSTGYAVRHVAVARIRALRIARICALSIARICALARLVFGRWLLGDEEFGVVCVVA